MEMELAKAKYVWWDLDCCNVPRGRDPYEIRWIIESALNKKFGDGPVTIFAIGNINRIPRRVLELISRAGIVIKHTPDGGSSIYDDLVLWTKKHPPPAILMLISDRENDYVYLEATEIEGYTILRTYVNQKPDSPKYACDVWLWKSLLTDTEQETPRPRQFLEGETDWYCILCCLGGQSFTDFTTHLKDRQHLRWEWITMHPNDAPTDEDLASLHSQLMKHPVKQSKPRKCLHGHHKRKANPMMVKFLSESYKDFESFGVAFMQAWTPRDGSFVPTEKDLASFHSQPKKHTVTVKKQSKPHKRKLKESHWVPRNWAAGPSEEGLASLEKNHL